MTYPTYVEELGAHVGQTVTVKGWLYNKREKGRLIFLLMKETSTRRG